MAEGSRPHVVDHSGQTEFGSNLFHDKIGRQHHPNDGSHTAHHEPVLPSISSSSSPFILPLRGSGVTETETVKPAEKKKGFFKRPKISLRVHARPQQPPAEVDVVVPPVRSSIESVRKRCDPFYTIYIHPPDILPSS
jgi:hypothetical protein